MQVDGYEALVFYHKPVLEAVAILAQNEGPLNEVVPVFGVDVMFNLGCYLCGQFCVKEHRLCEEPTLPVVYFVCLTEKKQVHEGILEALVTAAPLLKHARCVGSDLAWVQDTALKNHFPNTFRAKCDKHAAECFERAITVNGAKGKEKEIMNWYYKAKELCDVEFAAAEERVCTGKNPDFNKEMCTWFKRSYVRTCLQKYLRVCTLEGVGFVSYPGQCHKIA